LAVQVQFRRPPAGQVPKSTQNMSLPLARTPHGAKSSAPRQIATLQEPHFGRENMSLGTTGLENGSAATEEFAAQEAGASEVKDAAWLARGANRRAAVRSDRVSMDFIRISFVGR
jgi:hypothetical protein